MAFMGFKDLGKMEEWKRWGFFGDGDRMGFFGGIYCLVINTLLWEMTKRE
jgi:hypothetical protein